MMTSRSLATISLKISTYSPRSTLWAITEAGVACAAITEETAPAARPSSMTISAMVSKLSSPAQSTLSRPFAVLMPVCIVVPAAAESV